MPKLKYFNTAYIYKEYPDAFHGRHRKDMVVLHETQTEDRIGLTDIKIVEEYLAQKEYGIHGMTDKDGNIAWAYGYGNAVFYHAGGVNERAIGIEQVAKPPADLPSSKSYWDGRKIQLRATAKLLASINKYWNIPLRYSGGDSPGVTTHWSVSRIFPESEGHWDCHPVHLGGYYPALYVIQMARIYSAAGYNLV